MKGQREKKVKLNQENHHQRDAVTTYPDRRALMEGVGGIMPEIV